jgi:hypothetical protein
MLGKIAVVRVSAKAGHVRTVHIIESRDDGWIRGTPSSEPVPRHTNGAGAWYSPKHVVTIVEQTRSHDYNGIEPGTLVQHFGGSPRILKERRGAHYVMLDPQNGEEYGVSWEGVVPFQSE